MQITFSEDHNAPKDSQLIICMTGTANGIAAALKELQKGTISWPDNYKPIQGRVWKNSTDISVITPIWEGKKY